MNIIIKYYAKGDVWKKERIALTEESTPKVSEIK